MSSCHDCNQPYGDEHGFALVEAIRVGTAILHGPLKAGEEPCRLCAKAFRAALAVAVPVIEARMRREHDELLEQAMGVEAERELAIDRAERAEVALAAIRQGQDGEKT